MGILLSLAAALCWGVADFYAAFIARRLGSLRALLATQSLELVVVAGFLTLNGTLLIATPRLWFLSLALGLAQFLGVLCLYKAFEIGTLAIVAPVSSSFVVFTAILAWLGGERSHPLVLVGALLVFAGVVLVTRTSSQVAPRSGSLAGVGLALAAALFLSLVFWQFGPLAKQSAPLWPLMPLRVVTVLGVFALFITTRPARPARSKRDPSSPDGRSLIPIIMGVTIVNLMAWTFFDTALNHATATVVAALSSLFAAVTVFMACWLLKERLVVGQWVGVAVILMGILLVRL